MKAVVIGAGRMGRRHMQVVRGLGLDLVGIADRSPESLAVAGEEAGVPPEGRFLEVHRLLDLHPDLVVVATTAPSHLPYAQLAAEAQSRFVLCEKPLATSLADCDAILAACARSGTRLAVNHQMRFMEQYTLTRDIVLSDAIGGLSSVTVIGGNFGMAMNGTHYFEMFRFMSGEPARDATAWFSPTIIANPRGAEFEDRAGAIRLTTASEKRFYLDVGPDQGHGVQAIYAGPRGQVLVDELAGVMRITQRRAEDQGLPTTRYGMPAEILTRSITPADALAPTRSVLEALLNSRDCPTGEDGRLAVATLVAGYVSNENGHRTVKVDDADLPLDRQFPWA
jgi:predicted dehydrogenase